MTQIEIYILGRFPLLIYTARFFGGKGRDCLLYTYKGWSNNFEWGMVISWVLKILHKSSGWGQRFFTKNMGWSQKVNKKSEKSHITPL